MTVGAPDVKGREQILRIHARKVAVDVEVDLRQIARGTPGFSGAELANLVNEAALFAVRSGRQTVTDYDFDQARDKVLMGAERKSLTMSEHERITCAYHESGHAVVAALLPHADPLHKVTIIPRGRALGVTMQLPEGDRHTHTREFLEAQIAILMGGRIAEELFLRQMTSGAGNDIERATDIARRMVCEFGMSAALGPLAYRTPGQSVGDRQGRRDQRGDRAAVDDEVRELVMRGYETARQIIAKNRDAVRAMAEELLVVESLDADGIKAVIATRIGTKSREFGIQELTSTIQRSIGRRRPATRATPAPARRRSRRGRGGPGTAPSPTPRTSASPTAARARRSVRRANAEPHRQRRLPPAPGATSA